MYSHIDTSFQVVSRKLSFLSQATNIMLLIYLLRYIFISKEKNRKKAIVNLMKWITKDGTTALFQNTLLCFLYG